MTEQNLKTNNAETREIYRSGGTYFYCGAVMGRKNIFVTDNIIELLVNAFKMTEVRKDIKNLAYVIMPNFFYWIFRLSEKQDNPVAIYGELKKELTREILRNLVDEAKGTLRCDLAPVFRANEHVGRSPAGKILDVFAEAAKKANSDKKFKVWAPHTELRLLDSDELLRQKISAIKAIPVSDRWQLVKKAEEYPYLYLSEEFDETADGNVKLKEFSPVMAGEQLMPA